jgi:glycosyltransferase involved in cell wall biosynthesis
LIIVDDASQDDTLAIARKYEKIDLRIKVYANEKNLGDYSNRNKASEYAKGKYLKFVDSDDMIYPHGLTTMVTAMERFPEAGMGFSLTRNTNFWMPYLIDSTEAYQKHFFEGGLLYMGPTGAIYNRKFFEKIGKFNPEFNVASDYEFNLRAAFNHPVVIFQRDLVWWRQHEGQEIVSKGESYESLNYRIHKYFLTHKHCPLPAPERSVAMYNTKNLLARSIIQSMKKKGFKNAFTNYKKYEITFFELMLSMLPSSFRRKFQKP